MKICGHMMDSGKSHRIALEFVYFDKIYILNWIYFVIK